ncbi:MAG: hypothetical protein HHAS10_09380 [Candidatus Altimarinota bacterium]
MNPRITFDIPFRILLVMLPFMTVLSIFTREKLGIPGITYIKELLIFFMLLTVLWFHVTRRTRIRFHIIDGLILSYFLLMIGVSLFTTGISGVIYGGRYDFSFLIGFLTVFHGAVFLEKPTSYYIRLFLISSGAMLFISALLKWPLSEDLLLYLGYSGNPSNWQFGSSIPIFHGVDGANVRRFQGLLDGPNTMGAYLLVFTGMLTYYFRHYKKWHFFIGCIVLGIFILVIYTYSRSALLGFLSGVGIVILFLLPKIYKNYRVEFLSSVFILLMLVGGIFVQYSGTMKAIVGRAGSTNGHIERMKIGIERFVEKPFGQGLGSAGPAYRYVQNLENKDRKEIEEIDKKYIPESWYIQQMVEGGFLGLILFLFIVSMILYKLFRENILLAGMFFSILVMNLFLHTFESSIVSLLLFSLIGLILAPHEKKSR